MRVCLFISLVALLSACHERATPGAAATAGLSDGRHCYAHFSEEDTIQLTLVATRSTLVGHIKFSALGGTDRTDGPIEGAMHGDTLLADYWLEANGQRSPVAAPVAFLRRGNTFIEGFGDLAMHEGKFTFKSLKAIHFDTTRILRPTDCPELPPAY